MKNKTNHYASFQFIYGLYSLLIALVYFESVEDYTECYYIIKGIEKNEKLLNVNFAHRLDESDFEDLPENRQMCQIQNADKLINYEL